MVRCEGEEEGGSRRNTNSGLGVCWREEGRGRRGRAVNRLVVASKGDEGGEGWEGTRFNCESKYDPK